MITTNVTMNPAQASQAQAAGGQSGAEGFDFWAYLLGLQGNQENQGSLEGLMNLGTTEEGGEETSKQLSELSLGAISNALSSAMTAPMTPKADLAQVKSEPSHQQVGSSQWYASTLLAKNDAKPVEAQGDTGLAAMLGKNEQLQQQQQQTPSTSAFDSAVQKYQATVPTDDDAGPRISQRSTEPTLEPMRKHKHGIGNRQALDMLAEAAGPKPGSQVQASELPAEDPSAVSDVFQRVETMVHSGGGKMTVLLSPPELGSLEISVTTRGKRVEIEMTSDSDAAKTAIEGGLADLKQSLQAQDLVLSKTEVRVAHDLAENPFGSFMNGQSSSQGQSQSSARDGRQSEGGRQFLQPTGFAAARSMGSERGYLRSVTDGRVDIRI